MTKKKSKKISWDRLSPEKQDLYLALLWQDGYSENAIAEFLNSTKGTIVRRRHTLELTNVGRGKAKSKVETQERLCNLLDIYKMEKTEERGVLAFDPIETTTIPETELEEESEPDEQPTPGTEEPAEVVEEPLPPAVVARRSVKSTPDVTEPTTIRQRTASREKPKYQLAADWRLQCVHKDGNGFQCSYVKEPRSDFCKLHGG